MRNKVVLHDICDRYNENDYVIYTSSNRDTIYKALEEARVMINYWLDDDPNEKEPERWAEYETCCCDMDYYNSAINEYLDDVEYGDDCQNYSPTAEEMCKFCETAAGSLRLYKHGHGYEMHGYVVSRKRYDCRITIEGVSGYAPDLDSMGKFIEMFRQADEFEVDLKSLQCNCWYD